LLWIDFHSGFFSRDFSSLHSTDNSNFFLSFFFFLTNDKVSQKRKDRQKKNKFHKVFMHSDANLTTVAGFSSLPKYDNENDFPPFLFFHYMRPFRPPLSFNSIRFHKETVVKIMRCCNKQRKLHWVILYENGVLECKRMVIKKYNSKNILTVFSYFFF
jgi:hypothetical protein